MPDKTYRVRVEENNPERKPDSRSSTPKFWTVDCWKDVAHVEGTAKLVADALRSIADELDPPRPKLRQGGV